MAKKRKAAATPRAAQAAQQQAKPNPFELKRSKRKFDVLGRKIKGDGKNVVKSREDALLKVGRCWWARVAARVCGRMLAFLHSQLNSPLPCAATKQTAAQEDAARRVSPDAQGQHVHRPPLWRCAAQNTAATAAALA